MRTPQQKLDDQIIDVAFADLRINRDEYPMSFGPDVPRTIYFTLDPPEHIGDVLRVVGFNEKQSSELTTGQRLKLDFAITSLQARHVNGDSIRHYQPLGFSYRISRQKDLFTRDPTLEESFDALVSHATSIDELTIWRIRRQFFGDRPYQASFPFSVAAPGYSDDGSLAVVWLGFPELMHWSEGAYVLGRINGKWRIIVGSIVTYL